MRSFISGGSGRVSILALAIALLAVLSAATGGRAYAQAMKGLPDIPYILVDADAGTVLARNREFERWHPASLAKLMTAYVAFKAIRNGEIAPGSPVTVTANALTVPPSRMGYAKGTQLRFDTALTILLVKSANDIAIAIAESLSGSVPAFVARMNEEAAQLGLADTKFVNPNGLHDGAQYTSARDLVRLSAAVWTEFPQYRELFETPAISFEARVQGKMIIKTDHSYNLLLERFDGATGMKTGFICAAGYNIVASAERQGRRLVAVVLGAMSQGERATVAAMLLGEGFAMNTGTPLASLVRPTQPEGPRSQRGRVCSESAIKNRYDPLPETAVIKSAYLHERRVVRQPVSVGPGGIDADPSPAWASLAFTPKRNIPVPTRRPDYAVVDVDGAIISPGTLRGTVPLPTPNPVRTQ